MKIAETHHQTSQWLPWQMEDHRRKLLLRPLVCRSPGLCTGLSWAALSSCLSTKRKLSHESPMSSLEELITHPRTQIRSAKIIYTHLDDSNLLKVLSNGLHCYTITKALHKNSVIV